MCVGGIMLYQLQLGLPLKKSKVLCLDGDGAITTYLGATTSSKINNMITLFSTQISRFCSG